MYLLSCLGFLALLHLTWQSTAYIVRDQRQSLTGPDDGRLLQGIVKWDQDSLLIRGERVLFYSGEFHPFRLPVPDLWLDIFQKVKSLGYNGVSFYIDWALLEGHRGTINTTGIYALEPFFDAAAHAGIYLIARPGPYINAEVSGGGFPGWLGTINGTLRTDAPDFLSATDQYIRTVGELIAAAQITNGGPVVLYQVENEYTYPANNIEFPDIDYFQYVIDQARDAGIVVPIISNDAGPLGLFAPGNSTFGNTTVDIYGHDSYPLGFDCSNPNNWPTGSLPTNFGSLHEQQSPSTPYSIIEFQGGSFDPWGGPSFEQCNILISAAFERVFYKNNWSFGIKIFNQYMIYGGTNWGNLGHPGGYTSYDYAAVIAEDRSVQREKFSEAKLQANFLKSTPAYLTARPGPATTGIYTDTTDIAVTPLVDENTSTALYVVRHATYNTYNSTSYKLYVPTSIGNITVPQLDAFGTSLSLNGRDSKVHVTDYKVGHINVLYSTAEVLTWAAYRTKTVLILYGDEHELHEFAMPSSLGVYTVDGDQVATRIINQHTVFQWTVTPQQQVVKFDCLEIYLLWRNDAYNIWSLELPAADPIANYTSPSKESVIIRGGYLLRTAALVDDDLHITGEINRTTTLQVLGAPAYSSLHFNGDMIGVDEGVVEYKPLTCDLPSLSLLTWKAIDTLPELNLQYSDANWTSANLKSTFNPLRQTTPTVLYASDYGYHTGPLLYRGCFTTSAEHISSDDFDLSLRTQGGYAFGYQVYLGPDLVYTYPGLSINQDHNATISLPSLKPSTEYIFTVVIDHTGLNEDFNPGSDTMKAPRGIISYNITGYPQSAITWKLTGNLGGEDYVDKVRGPLNEGGFWFERQGFHLPGAPTSSPDWIDVPGGPTTGWTTTTAGGARFYSTTLNLNLPSNSYDIPLAFKFTNTTLSIRTSTGTSTSTNSSSESIPSNIRCNLYVNGYQFGKYINNIGPQTVFPVPEGILNYNGDNTIGVYLWNLNNNTETHMQVKLDGLELIHSSTPNYWGEGRRRAPRLSPLEGWTVREGVY